MFNGSRLLTYVMGCLPRVRKTSILEPTPDYSGWYEARVLKRVGAPVPQFPDVETCHLLFEPDEGRQREVCPTHNRVWPCACHEHTFTPVSMVRHESEEGGSDDED